MGQVTAMRKKPWFWTTWPVPPHCLQVSGEVPGSAPEPPQTWHSTFLGIFSVTSVPLAASRKETVRS